MKNKTYTGLNIQYPISQKILNGEKVIETRTYPIPEKYMGKQLAFIETPGKTGDFKARVVALITFSKCYKYKNKSEFYRDFDKHLVSKNSDWAWSEKAKWAWYIEELILLDEPFELKKRKGIVYTKDITIK